jgi:hypothetical protein
MQIPTLFRCAAASALIFGAALVLTPHPARADVSVEAGGAFNSNTTSGQAALSLGLFGTPILPFSAELTAAVPFNGGFAATADGRLNFAGTTIGAGIGAGNIGATSHTSVIYDAILAHGIAPHIALEARGYFGSSRPATIFAGVRLSI